MVEFGSLIDGKEVTSGEWLESRDPWTGEALGRVSIAHWNDIDRALEIAHRGWLNPPPPSERADSANNVAELIKEHQIDLVSLLIAETGKPYQFALGEVERLERTFRLASQGGDVLKDEVLDLSYDPRSNDYAGRWRRFAIGPVLGFVPYNWPLNLAAHKLAPALIAGCPVVFKLSSLTPLSSYALCKLLIEGGVRKDFVCAFYASNELAQQALKDDRIKMLSFTGSPKVGWMLKSLVNTKKVLLELGGNAPVIVEPDADLRLAAKRSLISGFGYAGQVCISAQNIFVHESVYNVFQEIILEELQLIVSGNPRDENTINGPLIDENAKKKVVDMINGAVSLGAIKHEAQAEEHPLLIPPTILENVPETAPAFCEEIFGPVLTLNKYSSLDELIKKLNAGKYRLHASIFTSSSDTAEKCFDELRYGGVIHNESPSLRFDSMPYGGEGESGFGREGVRFAIEEMTVPKSFLWRK